MLKENAFGYVLLNVVTAVLVPILLGYMAGVSLVMYLAEKSIDKKQDKKKISKNFCLEMPSAKSKQDIKIIPFADRRNRQKAA